MSSSALCVAAKAGFVERVEALLDASALVTVADKRGYSPLMCAAECPSVVESAILLIVYGADINYVAVRVEAAVSSPGRLARARKSLHSVGCAFSDPAPPPQPDSGLTALHVACKEGHTRMVSLLLRKGANATAADVGVGG